MVNPTYFFLPGIVVLGIATSYSDIKEGKIRNKWIIFAFIYALIIYLGFFLFKLQFSSFYLKQTLSNLLISLVIGFLMWDFGLWTAGDGKLFSAYAFLLPISTYSPASYILYFPSTTILINTFVPLFLFFFINTLARTSKKQKKAALKSTTHPKKILDVLFTMFLLGWIIQKIFDLVGIGGWMLAFLLMFVFFGLLDKLAPKKQTYIIYLLSFILITYDPTTLSVGFLRGFVVSSFLFLLLRFFVLELGFQSFTKEVKVSELKQGMVPAEVAGYEGQTMQKRAINYFNILQYIKDTRNEHVDIRAEGLAKKNILQIKDLSRKHKFDTFKVQEVLPFAPSCFLVFC